jgi:hypothetical protein
LIRIAQPAIGTTAVSVRGCRANYVFASRAAAVNINPGGLGCALPVDLVRGITIDRDRFRIPYPYLYPITVLSIV